MDDDYEDIVAAGLGKPARPLSTPSSNDPLDLISRYESGDQNVRNYRFDPTHTAQGYYQITNTNWRNYGPRAGVDLNVHPTAMAAPREVQRNVAQAMFNEQGYQPWAPYNAGLRQALRQRNERGAIQSQPASENYDDVIKAALNQSPGQNPPPTSAETQTRNTPDSPASASSVPTLSHATSRIVDDTGEEIKPASGVVQFKSGEFPNEGSRFTGIDELKRQQLLQSPPQSQVLSREYTANLGNEGENQRSLGKAALRSLGINEQVADIYERATGRPLLSITNAKPDRAGNFQFTMPKQTADFLNAWAQGLAEGGVEEGLRRAGDVNLSARQDMQQATERANQASAQSVREAEAATRRGEESPFIRGVAGGTARAAQAIGTVLPESLGGFERKALVLRAASEEADKRKPLTTTGEQIKAGLGSALPTAMTFSATAPLGAAQLPVLGALEGFTPEERVQGALQGAATAGTFALPGMLAPNITGAAQKILAGGTMAAIPATEAAIRGESIPRALAESLPYAVLPLLHRGGEAEKLYTIEIPRDVPDRLSRAQEVVAKIPNAELLNPDQVTQGAKPRIRIRPEQSAPEIPPETPAIVEKNRDLLNSPSFREHILSESVGGNAGEGRAAVNAAVDKNDKIVALGNIQNLPADIQSKLRSGELSTVSFIIKDALSGNPQIERVIREQRGTGGPQNLQSDWYVDFEDPSRSTANAPSWARDLADRRQARRMNRQEAEPQAQSSDIAQPVQPPAVTSNPLLDARLPQYLGNPTLREFAKQELPNVVEIAGRSPTWHEFDDGLGVLSKNRELDGPRGGQTRILGQLMERFGVRETYEALRSIHTEKANEIQNQAQPPVETQRAEAQRQPTTEAPAPSSKLATISPTVDVPAIEARIAERVRETRNVPSAEFTDEGIRQLIGSERGSLDDLEQLGVIQRTPEGRYTLNDSIVQQATEKRVNRAADTEIPAEFAQPETTPQRWLHSDFGEVAESADQRLVGKGRVRVIDENSRQHIVKRSDLAGRGNQRMIPVKESQGQPEPPPESQPATTSPEAAGSAAVPTGEAVTKPITEGGKYSKLGLGVESKAIEAKLTKGFEDLPQYDQVKIADQADQASKLLQSDPDKAVRIALGHERPQGNLLPESVFVAVENQALKTKDVDLLRDLATKSTLPTEATGMGQRIRMLAERDPDSAVSAIRDVQQAREKAANDRFGNPEKVIKRIKTEIDVEVRKSTPRIKDWNTFLDSIKC